jgi:uncharacterized membrane protein YdjX (TVP38/TMEM64 family)
MLQQGTTSSAGTTPRHQQWNQRSCRTPQIAFGVLLGLGVLGMALNFSPDRALKLLDWVSEHRGEGSVLFAFIYTAGVVLMLPAMVMAMSAGAIFGIVAGVLLSWLGSSVGQVIAFIAGRYVFRDVVVSYLTRQFPKWTAIDSAMSREGWKLVTLLRLSPIAPWNILNYALSVTSVPFSTYTIASSLSILPYLVLFVYFGSMARNLADIFTGEAKIDTRATLAMGIGSGIALGGFVWYATHVSRKAMGEALRDHADNLPREIIDDEEVAHLLSVGEPSNELRNPSTDAFSSHVPDRDAISGQMPRAVELSQI